jgi:hypothetical protein
VKPVIRPASPLVTDDDAGPDGTGPHRVGPNRVGQGRLAIRTVRAASTKRPRRGRTPSMTQDHRFEMAGEAAGLLEEMGFVAVARKRNEVVALEFWRVVSGQQRAMRHVVDEVPPSASALAQICAAEFRAAIPQKEA